VAYFRVSGTRKTGEIHKNNCNTWINISEFIFPTQIFDLLQSGCQDFTGY